MKVLKDAALRIHIISVQKILRNESSRISRKQEQWMVQGSLMKQSTCRAFLYYCMADLSMNNGCTSVPHTKAPMLAKWLLSPAVVVKKKKLKGLSCKPFFLCLKSLTFAQWKDLNQKVSHLIPWERTNLVVDLINIPFSPFFIFCRISWVQSEDA